MVIIDPGGSALMHGYQYGLWAAQGVMFKVKYCASACVMALMTVPPAQVCFYPDAWIGTHTAAMDANGNESPSTMRWERGREWIAKGWRKC